MRLFNFDLIPALLLFSICLIAPACSSSQQLTDNSVFKKLKAAHPDVAHEKALDKFLQQLETTIEAHAWDQLFTLCDKAHFRSQYLIGIQPPQYLAEIMGIHQKDNKINPSNHPVNYENLNTIKELSYTETTWDAVTGWVVVKGLLSLTTEKELEFTTYITVKEGAYYLIGAVG